VTGWSSIEEDPFPRLSSGLHQAADTPLLKKNNKQGRQNQLLTRIAATSRLLPQKESSRLHPSSVEKDNNARIFSVEFFIDLLVFRRSSS